MDDAAGLYRLEFLEHGRGRLLVYEGGVLSLDGTMRCRWKQDHKRYDWFFTDLRDDVVWYVSEYEDEVWGYRLPDGIRVESGHHRRDV